MLVCHFIYILTAIEGVGGYTFRKQAYNLRRWEGTASGFRSSGNEPDLFDYFDPLLSPHAYPNGISPDSKPFQAATSQTSAAPGRKEPFGFRTDGDPRTPSTEQRLRVDPSVIFDPTLSPHLYTNGTPYRVIGDDKPSDYVVDSKSDQTPLESKSKSSGSFGFRQPTAPVTNKPTTTTERSTPKVDPAFTFDPTLSPHVYANGTPDIVVGDADAVYAKDDMIRHHRRVGILLVDHGSRSEASNKRLHDIARAYQDYVKQDQSVSVVVRAAHMEIARPSIPDGIQSLLEDGVDEIICHPYFLSPGRHVTQDIPRILKEAVELFNIDAGFQLSLTDPVGSSLDLMLGAIHTVVERTATVPISSKKL